MMITYTEVLLPDPETSEVVTSFPLPMVARKFEQKVAREQAKFLTRRIIALRGGRRKTGDHYIGAMNDWFRRCSSSLAWAP